MLKLLHKDPSPHEIIENANNDYGIEELWGGFSGGKDSVVTQHFTNQNYESLSTGVIYSDTGIGTHATKQFVIEYCEKMDWKLQIVSPKPGEDYKSIVRKYGFPSPEAHKIIMRKLKIIPARRFLQSRSKTAALVSGVRKQESRRRFINASKPIHKDHTYFVSPMLYKSDGWMYRYYVEYGLRRSPVYEFMHVSGDCFCGCFSEKQEAKLLQLYYPELAEIILELEADIKDNPEIPPPIQDLGQADGTYKRSQPSTPRGFSANIDGIGTNCLL